MPSRDRRIFSIRGCDAIVSRMVWDVANGDRAGGWAGKGSDVCLTYGNDVVIAMDERQAGQRYSNQQHGAELSFFLGCNLPIASYCGSRSGFGSNSDRGS